MALAIRWLEKLGNKCRPMMRAGFATIISAALTYSSSRKDRNFDRTARARPGQSKIPNIIDIIKNTATGPQWDGTAADKARHQGCSGTERNSSLTRWSTPSIRRPR